MCGRYYVDDEGVNEIEKIVRQVSEKMVHNKGDIYLTDQIPIIRGDQDTLALSTMV